jgi:hypothetical protein
LPARAVIVGSAERASHDRIDPHDTEEARRHEIDRHHPPVDPQIDVVHRRVGLGEDVRVRSQRVETPASEFRQVAVRLLRAFDGVDLGDVWDGVGPEHQHVEDREEDGHQAESNRDGDDDGERCEWRAPERAKGVLKVADGVVDERGAALVATFVGGDGRRPERSLCLRPGLVRRQALLDQFHRLALDVK